MCAMVAADHSVPHQPPHRYFNKFDRGVMRLHMALQPTSWFKFPGHSLWWPDDDQYYSRYGFSVRRDLQPAYRKAFRKMFSKKPPRDWAKMLIYDKGQHDLVWAKEFMG